MFAIRKELKEANERLEASGIRSKILFLATAQSVDAVRRSCLNPANPAY
jgi:hypothetical protein